MLKRALSELYLNLVLLQNFQQLNHTGFRKILKKYDKLARSSRGKTVFQKDVCEAYFWTSKTVTDMLVQAEKIMIQTLEEGDRSKAMKRLRVPPLGTEKTSHWTSCATGLFCGILLLSIVVVCIAFVMWPSEEYSSRPHLEPSLRAMRAGLLLSLWFFGFAINTYGWRRAGVNHVLIFEFDPRNYLGFMDLFAVCLHCVYTYNVHACVMTEVYTVLLHFINTLLVYYRPCMIQLGKLIFLPVSLPYLTNHNTENNTIHIHIHV